MWREVALPGCEGLYAYARGEYERAWHHLSVAVPRMAEVGGSHAQRDLFEQVLLDAALKSGRLTVRATNAGTAAQRPILTACRSIRRWPRCMASSDLRALAEQARSRAALTRARHAPREP